MFYLIENSNKKNYKKELPLFSTTYEYNMPPAHSFAVAHGAGAASAFETPRPLRSLEHKCMSLTSCPPLTSQLADAQLQNGGADYSVRSLPPTHISSAFVVVNCKPWGFDYVNAVAKYFWQTAMTNCEKMYLAPSVMASASKTSNNSP